jgi:hypothetical protein
MSPSPAREQPSASTRRRGDAEKAQGNSPEDTLLLPVETDIYILPDGRVIVADLPAELAARLPALGQVEPCEITTYDFTDPAA